METNNTENAYTEEGRIPSSRPSAKSMEGQSRKVVLIGIGIAAAIICIGIAVFLSIQVLASHPDKGGVDDAADTLAATASNNEGDSEDDGDDYLLQEYVPPETNADLEDDPRLKTSTGKNTTKPKNRVVYLTFDDGPSDLTPSILKTLKKNDVKATWFVVGSHNNLDNLKKIWDAGHQVALHSNSHNYNKIYKSAGAFFADLDELAKKVHKRIGVAPTLIRFPGGSINSYNDKTRKKIMEELKKRNWHYFDWNASTEDAVSQKARTTKQIISSTKKSSKDKHSVCLLMHDTNAKKSTAKALDKIIKYYKKKGFKFKYLDATSYGYHF